eukprot:6179139-Pleurochrysis_carterae.AAC.1
MFAVERVHDAGCDSGRTEHDVGDESDQGPRTRWRGERSVSRAQRVRPDQRIQQRLRRHRRAGAVRPCRSARKHPHEQSR